MSYNTVSTFFESLSKSSCKTKISTSVTSSISSYLNGFSLSLPVSVGSRDCGTEIGQTTRWTEGPIRGLLHKSFISENNLDLLPGGSRTPFLWSLLTQERLHYTCLEGEVKDFLYREVSEDDNLLRSCWNLRRTNIFCFLGNSGLI